MKSILSITLIFTLFFSVIAKADQVSPVPVNGVRVWNSTSGNANIPCGYESINYDSVLNQCQSDVDAYIQQIQNFCSFTGDWYIKQSWPNLYEYRYDRDYIVGDSCQTNGAEILVIIRSSSTTTGYECPATHPIHIDTNNDGIVQSTEKCDLLYNCNTKFADFYSDDSVLTPYNSYPTTYCDPDGCEVTINFRDYLGEGYGSEWWSVSGQYNGNNCTIQNPSYNEDGENIVGETQYQEVDPDCDLSDLDNCEIVPTEDYDPEDGEYDQTPDTDTNTTDANNEHGTMDEDLGVIKNLLSEIENSTDDLEGIAKDGVNELKKGNSNTNKNGNTLKSIDNTLKKILASDGVQNSGGSGSGSGSVDSDGSGCPDGQEAECEIRDALTQEPEGTDYGEEIDNTILTEAESQSIIANDLKYDINLGTGSCPANIFVPAFGHNIQIDLSIFCNIAVLIKVLVIISAWLTAARIYGSIT